MMMMMMMMMDENNNKMRTQDNGKVRHLYKYSAKNAQDDKKNI
jgi:hypothetical protein